MKRAVLLVGLGACSSTLEPQPDADLTLPAECQVSSFFDNAIVGEQHAQAQDDYVGLVGALADEIDDVFSLELYGAITPGIYDVDTQYKTCAVCVLIYADYNEGALGQTMLAASGTVTITSVEDRLTGRIDGAELHQVELAEDQTSTEVTAGCVTTINTLEFDAAIER